MPKPIMLNLRVNDALSEFVSANVGRAGAYQNANEYGWKLIRRDKEGVEGEHLAQFQAELTHAFATPESEYQLLDADAIIARNAAA